mmetsp:Transcript_33055/g.50687  ORF Transcript_33055/g.50687 Transcript_33055/m.50687 type:complete len:125 (+) Transcript_33055:533-907(+)
MRSHEKLYQDFKKDPEKVQADYDLKVDILVSEIHAANLKKKQRSKVEVNYPSLSELYEQYKIPDLSQLDDMLRQPLFLNKALALTCLGMLLETFGQFFISIQTSFGYMIYLLNYKYIIISIYIS